VSANTRHSPSRYSPNSRRGRARLSQRLPKQSAAAWPTVRDQIQAALDDPAKADYGYDGYFGPTTFAQTIDAFYNADLVVHTWDLATATDLTEFISIDPVEMEKVIADLAPMSEMMRQPGLFGPARDVADDADAQTRFLAFFGRAS
jgi:uncharacterized protein (TIGR03086 family)